MSSTEQYVFDFSSRANDRCSKVLGLRSADLGMSIGRVEGIIELVQRLVLFCRYIPEGISEDVHVRAQVTALAARIERRRSVSERTVRNWVRDARMLGIISVQYTSHQRGGPQWNNYTVHFARVIELVQGQTSDFRLQAAGQTETCRASSTDTDPPRRQMTSIRPAAVAGENRSETGGNGRKRLPPLGAETVAAPGAEMIAAPNNVLTQEHTQRPQAPDLRLEAAGEQPVVVSVLIKDSFREEEYDHWRDPEGPRSEHEPTHADTEQRSGHSGELASTSDPEITECVLVQLGMNPYGASSALRAAASRGLRNREIAELVELYRETPGAEPSWLHRWLTGRSTPPKRRTAAAQPDSRALAERERTRLQLLRTNIVRQARRQGLDDDRIRQLCHDAGVEF